MAGSLGINITALSIAAIRMIEMRMLRRHKPLNGLRVTLQKIARGGATWRNGKGS